MLIEAAHRAEAAAKEMLAGVNAGSASCAELREMLTVSKATMAVLSSAQTFAASIIAKSERHGDGGTQVLADTAGLTRHEARTQVTTAQAIEAVPAARDAVETGRVSQANARRLAEAIEKTSGDTVASDAELLAKAESMRPEQFTREARRWTADRQDDGGEADYRRLRAKRRVRIWDADDGLVHLHGELDPVAGRRIANRLRAQASRLHDADKKQTAASSESERHSFDQCMADALDNLTSSIGGGGGKPFADICVVAHVDDATGELIAELPDGERLPKAVLEQLSCNAKLTGVVYDRKGKPIWRTHSRRTVTESQWQLLIAKWGGCFHCGANPGICQGHHIEPASQGGPPNSTTWSRRAGPAITASTTTTGRSERAPTAGTPFIHRTTSTTGQRAPLNSRDPCSSPGPSPSPPVRHRPSPTRLRDRPAGPAHKPPEPRCTGQEPPATDRELPRPPIWCPTC